MRVHVAPMEAVSGDLVARPVTRRNAQILTRFPVHEHSAAMWAAMWAAAVAAEFGVLVPVIFAHGAPHAGYDIAFRLLGGSFAACGLIAWHRRPDSRSGALMVADRARASSPRRCSSQFEAPIAQTSARTSRISGRPVRRAAADVPDGRPGPVERSTGCSVGAFVLSLSSCGVVWLLFLDDGQPPRRLPRRRDRARDRHGPSAR